MQNYSSAQNKSWYWATELKKIWGVKKPPLLCSKHLTKITDVHSPETILAAPSPVLQTPTELSTPFRSISLHKAHKLLRSEIHSEKLHFRLDLSDQRHTHADQHTDEGSTPVITTRWWITKSTELRWGSWVPEARTARGLWTGHGRMHKSQMHIDKSYM